MTRSARAARALIAAAALAGSAALVAACGSSGGKAAPPAATVTVSSAPPGGASAPASSPAPTSAPAPSGPPPCATSALRVSVPTGQGNAAAGSSYYPIVFTNASGSSCTLYGYPGVSFVTGVGGSQIGVPATETPTYPRKLVTLAPGRAVHAELQVVNAENYPPADCGMVTAHWLKVYPPNQTAPLYASFTAQACTKPRTILAVQTVQPGASGT
jgi:Protein of unknown function (DUF4232)